MQRKKRAAFYTLGCRVNQYETRAVNEKFEELGFETGSFDEKCDVYVINTCTVTAESDHKSRKLIRRARKAGGKDAIVIAMGCMVQISGESVLSLGVDYAVGNREKISCAEMALELLKEKKNAEVKTADYSESPQMEQMSINGSDNTRAFVKIADGCNNRCSYCIIPKARGPVSSKAPEDVCKEISNLAENGYHEAVLTGIETAAYGKDIEGLDLVSLVEKVDLLDCEGLFRIRLGSLEPTVINENTAKRLSACKKLMPHYHLSLQSGSDGVLALMRRKYNTKMFSCVTENLRKYIPDVTFTTDIIVGFPGETDEMFEETCAYVKKTQFLFAHIFPYSDRAGTDASKMTDKIDEGTKRKRAETLKRIMTETRKKVIASFLGTERDVLVETVKDGEAYGHTDNFIEVKIVLDKNRNISENTLVKVRLEETNVSADYVLATLV